ncbi:hydrocephalus-inducing protein homolog isoform X3 [Canis lupus familiaris]|uniref:hydrocephalus-inducing protein homolog isoform X3 n=1 Tax=Canis lupus familiaris TaxID=9615 RepID=UPI000BAA1BD2|nr:hydrocephalus-inducing protein homolog isoform X3 [Canis lupus familiaris]XP_038523050.1 hydrocephalus-inducing protein homolog isoform X3 [Canis lupus familiaris]|eukprot:XP_022274936.1 hydrocephalus-inducing protein homolog isoform X3 [Canis lupus familiaris]
MTSRRLEESMGAFQMGLVEMLKGFKSKVLPPLSPRVVTKEEVNRMLTPSEFLKEMSLTTEQRLANTRLMCRPQIIELLDMGETTHQKFSGIDLDQALFQPFPSEIVFQNYTPCEVYEVPLVLRNNDKDYAHVLTCITEREKFIVPIKARGARAILDFPDELNFSTCPVKYSTQKILLVRNIGNKDAVFHIKTHRPFSVEPSVGTLNVGESMQLEVEFEPRTVGSHSKRLFVHYDTGEKVFLSLYGAAIDMNIRLDRNSLFIEKTYISLASQRTVTIHNRSNIIAHFQWKIFATQEEEDREKCRVCDDLSKEEKNETDEFLEECIIDPSLRERLSILSRTFENQRRLVQADSMLFLSNIFTIEPLEGDIWPNSSAEITVYFNPLEAKLYQQTVYCDISGREIRLPLRIRGEGMGPKIHFNFELLDIGKVFVGSIHCYEAMLSNKGSIDALFNVIPPTSALGACFVFSPKEGIIEPNGVQAVQISFSSAILGHFEEEFLVNVNGSPEPVKLIIRGCVIGPTFHFNVPALHFGDVSFGFPHTLICSLNNTSLVPMTFKLRVPGDGNGRKSISTCEQYSDNKIPSWNKDKIPIMKPKEFTITPSSGTIRPQGFAAIRVTLCSNTVQKYELALVVDVEGIGEEVLALLITARCIVPNIHMVNTEVDFGHCFLKYPYKKTVQLVNHDDLPGCYEVLPQVHEDSPAVLLTCPMPCGVIPPRSTAHIPLALETQVTGEYRSIVYISIFGSPDPPMVCHLRSIGEGPVIYVHPTQVDFGNIYVLKDSSRILNLSNQSFIPALFQARMAHKKSLWMIEPKEGMVPPETNVQLTLTAKLNDILTFKDTVILDIENSNTYRIPVQASGIGSTIVSDKPFAPELNLGARFSLDTYYYRFKLTNKGRRVQQLFWMNEDFHPQDKLSKKGLAKKGLVKNQPQPQDSQEPRAPQSPVFQLHPVRMELYPNQTIDVILEGYSATPRVVKEKLVCHAIIGAQKGKSLVMTVNIICEFIAPLIQLSTKQLIYRLEKKPNTILEPDYQPLVMKNISTLPVNVLLSTSGPFFICETDKSPLPLTPEPIKLEVDGEKNLLVKFDPSYRSDLNNWVAEEILEIKYMEHPQIDSLNLRGEVHYPNLSFETMELDFGCILNDTEVIRYITITNCSPLMVKFRWFFLVDNEENRIRFGSWPRKAYSTPLSQVESIPITSVSVNSPAVPATESPEVDLNDFKTILMDEDVGSEERENKKPEVPTMIISDVRFPLHAGLKLSSAETEKTDPNQSQMEFQEPPWLFEREEMLSIGIEEVFDILPLYGVLRPHSSHQISVTFYGHCDIIAQAKALCEVEGGPTYEILLRGEASLVNYSFDTKDINYGLQLFNRVTENEITLKNTGKVGFEFKVLTDHLSSPDNLLPGVPLILPLSGFISSNEEQVLKVYYLPGVPEIFQRSFQIQIAHLDPENITLHGEGIFPRICLDLPRKLQGNEKYEAFLNQARKNLEKENKYEILNHLETTEEMPEDESFEVSPQLQMEVERLIVQGYAMEHQKTIIPDSPDDFSYRSCCKLAKVQLPEYILDFGYIIFGDVRTHIIKITNTSYFPVSFHAEKRVLHDTGFSTELDRVKNLPYCETETFEVKFDPQGASLPVGNKEVILPIKVIGGPTVHICLQAKVTIPTMTLSCEKVEFATIQCGQCLVETIQFSNPLQVPCEWFVHSHEPVNKLEKHMPKYLRRKLHAELKPKTRIFEIQPTSGILDPGERSNVQVKFMPKEEKFYSQTLVFQIAQSAQKLTLLAQGQGLEPHLEFSPSILELGPLLPYAPGDEAEVVVKNPCGFPIEFYSLEFDQQYLIEEKILRTLKGYDSYNTLLLPPRLPGEKLPPELYDYFKEMKRSKEEQMKAKYLESLVQENEDEDMPSSELGTSASTKRTSLSQGISVTSNLEERHIPTVESKTYPDEEEDEESLEKIMFQSDKLQSIDSHSTEVGEVENNPVSRAIARHLGIDISAEGRMTKNRKGIAIIIHGTPLSGKTATAISMARYYNAACLNIDSIVLEAITDGNNIPGIRARELCIRAAIEQSMKEEESAQEVASGQTAVGQTRLSSDTLGKLTSESTLVTPEMKPAKTLRGSMLISKSKAESHGSGSQKQHHQHASETPQVSSSPLPSGPTQRRLSISASIGGETGLMSCVLPEDLFTQILAERIQLSDCFRGVVFDSVETLFARNAATALLCLLKAIGNREHIYVINMAQDYTAMKAQEKAKKEQEEHRHREALEKEKERLQNMDEEEYDAMTEEEKVTFNREVQQALRERKKRELERLAREMQEKKLQQELERQREEDEQKRRIKRPKQGPVKEEPIPKKSQTSRQILTFSKLEVKMDALERKASVREHISEKEDPNRRRKNQLADIHMLGFPLAQEQEDSEGDLLKDADRHLAQKFKAYELTLKDIQNILMNWDRKQGILLHHTAEDMPHEPDDQRQVPSGGRRGRKDRERERAEKERAEKERQEREKAERERLEKLRALEERSDAGEGEGEEEHHEGKKDLGVPFMNIQTPDFEGLSWKQALENDRLPKGDQILDILGLGSSGPPIPSPTLFSIISYPMKRLPLATTEILKHFLFVIPPSDELSLLEEKREAEAEAELSTTMGSGKTQEEQATSSKGSRQKPKEKADQARDTQKDKRRMAINKKALSGGMTGAVAPLSDMDQNSFSGQFSQEKFIRLNHFRWIVPANGEVTLRIHFSSNDLGNFDQTFNFEVLGTHRQYQLYCRGVCSYPYICQDPKVVFPQRKLDMKLNEVIFKKYIINTRTFYFGPLLCGKSRDKYKSSLFPGNMEALTILNNSPMVAEVFFCFQNDVKASTYFLEPINMILKPNEKQTLNVWAYPTAAGVFEDCIICCIKENPEPAVFKLVCQGVRPELELEPRQLHFDRLLLHRKESKVILLRNITPLPVAWRITSLEHLGDDFTVSTMQGIILPKAEYSLQVHFQPSKPVYIKKMIRLEVLDADNLVGVVQIENILVFAESYDVALDITFPKGAEGGLDFGIVRVMEEVKQPLQLKNRGKYEIMFSFSVDSLGILSTNVNSMISVQPKKGSLIPTEKPTNVQVSFRAKKEVKFEHQPVLRCQIIEPNITEGGEIIASIPIKFSVNAVYSKYNISPSSIINFGALICGSRKSITFTIENQGVTDFKYALYRLTGESPIHQKKAVSHIRHARSRESDSFYKTSPSKAAKFSDAVQKEVNIPNQARFTHGMFTVYPGFGSIPSGGIQVITVDCVADPVGRCEEFIAIDISDRDPRDQPAGIPYSLLAEACLPAFVTDNNALIFEEHQICSSANLLNILQTIESGGLFVEDENKFIFCNVLVGHQAKARFKISNVGKIACDVNIVVKPVSNKLVARIVDIFEVEPNKMCVASRSHAFATVTFTPQTMQTYQCIFEATLDGLPSSLTKNRSLVFDIVGEGNLPRVTVVRPVLCNQYGNPLLLFKRLLLGHSEKLPLILKNNGTIPAQLHVDLKDQQGVFSLKRSPTTSYIYITEENKPHAKAKKAHTASLVVPPGNTAGFEVVFQSQKVGRMTGIIHLSVINNQYEETIIHMVGEGYEDDITLDNIHGLVVSSSPETPEISEIIEENTMEDLVTAALVDHIQFGDCHIGNSYNVSFTITNHSQVNVIRFEWPLLATVSFSPQIGHLHPRCAKDIAVTMKSDVPINLKKMGVKCKLSRITFQFPADQVPDWDDRMRTVKWVDVHRNTPGTFATKRKVIETDPEPAHSIVEENYRELHLQISANVNFASYRCHTSNVHFKETLVYQTRVFELELINSGNVQLEFNWVSEDTAKAVSFAKPDNQGSSQKDELSQGTLHTVSTLDSATDHWNDVSLPPFSVDPSSGIVPAGKTQKLKVKFSPLETGDFESNLFCQIPNLPPGEQGPVLLVKGRSFLPLCHFDLKHSDYISGHRRNPDLRGPSGAALDSNTRVIEFTSVGIGGKSLRTFTILNPTNSTYSFCWTSEETESLQNPPAFTCLTEKGLIHPEKKAEIVFQFTPFHLDITEAFWAFLIPEHNITIPFLLVGKATDPLINLDKSHINFSCLLIGREARETVQIINKEEQGFHFAFQDNSRYSEGFSNSLVICPMEGWIPPLSRFPIDIFFTPKQEGDVNFNLICNVKKKAQPLTLNVKAEGYTMNAEVKCKDRTGLITLLSPKETNIINFYEVELNECVQCELSFINTGKFNFSFQAELSGPKALLQYLEFSPIDGSVDVGQSAHASLSFQPFKKCVLKGLELRIKISHGPMFMCSISGCAVSPAVHFSFTSYNFGTCFIYQAGMPPYKQILVVTNKEETSMSLDCLYTNTAHLEVNFRVDVIKPGKTLEIPITFYPRESISYRELIPFEINGLSQQVIEIKGKGTEMKISILDPANRIVKLGAVLPGQVVKKTVSIMNNSHTQLTFSQSVLFSIPELQEPKVITLIPFSNISLKPKEVCKLEVIFAPKKRIPPFSEEVFMECMGLLRPLFLLSGCCQALEISLDQEHLPFGPVVYQTQATRRILMLNTGDVGARFKWDVRKFEPHFSIRPEEGYITAGMEVSFEVTYHPTEVGKESLYKNLLCFIQGGSPLSLTLSGVCVGPPAVKEVVNFTCQVRSKHTQTIMLSNRTNQTWNLHPIFEGEHWEGPEFITLEPHQQNKPYEITYRPRTMNLENRKHQGTLFFPLPDGTGWLYMLHGVSELPKAVANIYREVPCKTPYMELLPINNWLNKPQRFRVIVEMVKPERPDLSVTLKGLDYIDVLSGSKKDYKLNFFSHKEGLYSAKVIFRNEVTSEFLYYMVSFRVIPSGVIRTIEMVSPVRQSTSASIKVENPLPYSVTFSTDCRVPDISLPSQFVVPANSEGIFSFEFQPLRAGETFGRLTLHNSDLGYYLYELNLKATPALPEKPIHFQTTLGSGQSIFAKFTNYTRQKTEYYCRTDCQDFHMEKVITAAPGAQGGTEVSVEVYFEPSHLGETKGILMLSSITGGEYTIPLFGVALPPKPQGPFLIRAGYSIVIPFKNIFYQTVNFSFMVENPAFSVRAVDSVRPKKINNITVYFEGNPSGSKTPITSKLIVSCPPSEGNETGIKWVYYLKGITP